MSGSGPIKAGWAEADLTPGQPVLIAGQFHARVSEGVLDPVTATVLALESEGPEGARTQAVMVSCDLATVSNELRDAVRARVTSRVDGPDPRCVFMGATHSHTAPDARLVPYGMEFFGTGYRDLVADPAVGAGRASYGMWPDIGLEIMTPADYIEMAADRIADAVVLAWERRARCAVAYGLGHAVVGRNRRLTYEDGSSRMYGKSGLPEFRHVEGYEDHSVYAMMTYDADRRLTGMVVNVPCPAQVREHQYTISADYWHETRQELRRRFGEGLHVLAQCAPAGDQSPHVLVGKRAEERMWRLRGRPEENAPCEEIARQVADAVSGIVPWAERETEETPVFAHTRDVLHLPRRRVSKQDVEDALAEAEPFRQEYARQVEELRLNPGMRSSPRWYTAITKAYRRMERGERVRKRLELQEMEPRMPVDLHALRLGDVAFATNPFELYLDYAVRIRERCRAVQTFLVQKAGCSGTYLPSARSVSGGGYGSVPASMDIGPEGGDALVEWTVEAIRAMWSD